MDTIEFWFDFGSPYAYLSASRIEAAAETGGLRVQWRPFLLGAIFKRQGWDTSPFNIYPAKGRYMWRDLERISAARGLTLRKPTVFPRNGLLASRIACAYADQAWVGHFIKNTFEANFVLDREISDPAVIKAILEDMGQPADEILAEAQTPASKDRLRAQTERAVACGIFGAPSFRVGDELFWGDDRLDDAIRWARA